MISTLATSGFRFAIAAGDLKYAQEGWAEVSLELTLNDGLSGRLCAVTTSYSPVDDLHRLGNELISYVSRLRADAGSDENIEDYVPLSLAFRLSALDGESFADGNGAIDMAVYINVGEGAHRVYVGAAEASFEDVLKFADNLLKLAEHLRR